MMKKIQFLSVILLGLIFNLLSCEKSYPTHYDIDGEYVIDQVIVLYEDLVTGDRWDSTYYSGEFSLYKPLTPLDSFTVGVTRFKLTDAARTFYWDKDETVFGNPWRQSADADLRQDILSGQWDYLQIHFMYTNMVTRSFELSLVGIDDFQCWVRQYPFKSEGPKIDVKYYFHEVGP